jgi:hypothetical protein
MEGSGREPSKAILHAEIEGKFVEVKNKEIIDGIAPETPARLFPALF